MSSFLKKEFSVEKPEYCSEYFTDKGYLKYDLRTQTFYNDKGSKRVSFWFKEINDINPKKVSEFEIAVTPLMKYLACNHHPHVSAIVRCDVAELVVGKESFVTQEFVLD